MEILSEDGSFGNVNSSTWLGPTVTSGDKVTGRISYDSKFSSQTSAGSAIFQNPSARVSSNTMLSGIHYNQASLSDYSMPTTLGGYKSGALAGTWGLENLDQLSFEADLLSLTPSAVPEPACGAALLAGLGVQATVARRRRAG